MTATTKTHNTNTCLGFRDQSHVMRHVRLEDHVDNQPPHFGTGLGRLGARHWCNQIIITIVLSPHSQTTHPRDQQQRKHGERSPSIVSRSRGRVAAHEPSSTHERTDQGMPVHA
jgi:hypothetical protein